MKKIYTLILICFTFFAKAQLKLGNGLSKDDTLVSPAKSVSTVHNYKKLNATGIPCNPNTFWGFNLSLEVEEFEISGNTVISNGVVAPGSSGSISLAFCNNFNGTFSPTFYSTTGFIYPVSFDGTNWAACPGSSNCNPVNAGGNGNYLYYMYNNPPSCIVRYDGNLFTQIYTDTMLFLVADIAVDDDGNIWSCVGAVFPITEYIRVINPAGQIIKQYPCSLNTSNAYGCFLLNDTLYIGFGNSNPDYPLALLPVSFTADSAIVGTPVNFNMATGDFASCNTGSPLAAIKNNLHDYDLMIYPTISSDYINCTIHTKNNSAITISITDILGNLIYKETKKAIATNLQTKISITDFSKGIYFIEINDGKEKAVKKFVKE